MMANMCIMNPARRELLRRYPLVRRCFNNSPRIRIKGAQNLPENDSMKSLSNRDKEFFSEVKKLRSSLHHDPPVLTKGRRPFYPANTAVVTSDVVVDNNNEEESTTGSQQQPLLPRFHASAFLNPKHYCRISAKSNSTISGSDAVRRLIRGKRNLLETMREETHMQKINKEKKGIQHQKLYVLRDHGVPIQLFQHLLKASNTWLSQQINASELSVQNTSGIIHFDRMLVRAEDGSSTVKPWPEEWENDMELYLTVMSRIATSLSDILQPVDGLSKPRLKQWNVDIRQQDIKLSEGEGIDFLVDDNPIVEFSTLKKGMGQISIYLRSSSSATKGEESNRRATSKVFVGVFDTKHEG